jgi:opine dehydrogenase
MIDIAIIGGGHVGVTLLADLEMSRELHGKRTRLFFLGDRAGSLNQRTRMFRGELRLNNMMENRQDTLTLSDNHFGMLRDPSSLAAMSAAAHIVITVPDIPVLRLRLLRMLVDSVPLAGKALVFVRAGQGGQPVIAEFVRTRREFADASIILIEDSFYGTRVAGGEISFKRKLSVNTSIYSKDSDSALAGIRSLFPLGGLIDRPSWPDIVLRPGINLLFDPLGYIIHVGVTLYRPNLMKTARGVRYTHYIEGIDEALAGTLDKLDHERVALASHFDVEAQLFPDIIERQYGLPRNADFYAMMQSCRNIYRSLSPRSMDELRGSRHILEDVPGLCTIEWLARTAGVTLPYTQKYACGIRQELAELGVEEYPMRAYMPILNNIVNDVDHVRDLLTAPHLASLTAA